MYHVSCIMYCIRYLYVFVFVWFIDGLGLFSCKCPWSTTPIHSCRDPISKLNDWSLPNWACHMPLEQCSSTGRKAGNAVTALKLCIFYGLPSCNPSLLATSTKSTPIQWGWTRFIAPRCIPFSICRVWRGSASILLFLGRSLQIGIWHRPSSPLRRIIRTGSLMKRMVAYFTFSSNWNPNYSPPSASIH